MVVSVRRAAFLTIALGCLAAPAAGQGPQAVEYLLSFPAPEQRWMQVDVTIPAVPAGTLQLCMSRTSPGRYALHEFAKNVYDVRAFDAGGGELRVVRTDTHQWDVPAHGDAVRVSYKVFGDTLDGTYLAVDRTHAHMNAPATLMWARGLDDRPARVTLQLPPGRAWEPATQLFSTGDPLAFTAPNLQYLMDSPIEIGDIAIRTFTVAGEQGHPAATFRVAVHAQDGNALDALVGGLERIVRAAREVFGEFPAFEPGSYTFLFDNLPWARGDGMEHRNSTVITSAAAPALAGAALLDTAAHEFVHAWNVERIRPRSLEPFDFEHAMASPDLWLGEGFTSYYGQLVLIRAGLAGGVLDTARALEALVNAATATPALGFRPPTEMSLLAPLVDGAQPADRTNLESTFLSYYSAGAAVALALDLELRARSEGRVSLDTLMRALWQDFGAVDGPAPGLVGRPYTLADFTAVLGRVSGDETFAGGFVGRHVAGRAPIDYAPLLARAGYAVRTRWPGRPTLGALRLDFATGGARVAAPPLIGSPAWTAGVAQDDRIVSVGDVRLTSQEALTQALRPHAPGDEVVLRVEPRGAGPTSVKVRLGADAAIEVIDLAQERGGLSPQQRAFRDAWLERGSRPDQRRGGA